MSMSIRMLTWRWKVSNVYRKGDSRTKEGDDYPARLYVMFVYDPDRASLGKKLRYKVAKTVYGQYPPDSSISYIWDNQATGKPFIINAYVQRGPNDSGQRRCRHGQHLAGIYRGYCPRLPPWPSARIHRQWPAWR